MKIIGMIHLESLLGYPQHKNMEYVLENAKKDAKQLLEGGVDGILIENTYDDPHTKKVGPEIISAYTRVALEIKKMTNIPLGICVLWNDYKAALSIAKIVDANFIRIPIFIEAAVTASGIIEGEPYEVMKFRKQINAENIKIYTDIQVKHAGHIAQRDILDTALEAIDFKSDGIIITGQRTGDQPIISQLKKIRENIPNSNIIIGSGTNISNVNELAKYANIAIVGTYFKTNGRIDCEKVKKLMDEINIEKNKKI
jgi:uncharacterized protein